ncbi:aspartyl protease family protein [Colwellia chukchiensis]|uniref:Aspartyl protease family protein n=1 Tax=Colwellia chukchiensis TaxID=641665 RepID=A0A1H7L268_9GAMM|nr:TIGR02281 family clan AA aspartic protease [Colwellia chukchiensis]SEK93163.1 aspartyl protease family protein [Colwellia chukchiensis]
MTEHDPSSNLGKSFIWLAWIIAIALLVFVFQDLLEQQYNPNQEPKLSLQANGKAEVILQQNRHGHYVTNGAINGSQVTFLLDTGATQVSIPGHIAKDLGLRAGATMRVQTANGSINVYQTQLNELRIGNIYLYNVAAHINPSMASDEILLGMSALKRVEFSQTGKQLILREQL